MEGRWGNVPQRDGNARWGCLALGASTISFLHGGVLGLPGDGPAPGAFFIIHLSLDSRQRRRASGCAGSEDPWMGNRPTRALQPSGRLKRGLATKKDCGNHSPVKSAQTTTSSAFESHLLERHLHTAGSAPAPGGEDDRQDVVGLHEANEERSVISPSLSGAPGEDRAPIPGCWPSSPATPEHVER